MAIGCCGWFITFIVICIASLIVKKQFFKGSVKKTFGGKKIVLTGASSGIGLALAHELASYGAEICLVARRKDRLVTLQVSIY